MQHQGDQPSVSIKTKPVKLKKKITQQQQASRDALNVLDIKDIAVNSYCEYSVLFNCTRTN